MRTSRWCSFLLTLVLATPAFGKQPPPAKPDAAAGIDESALDRAIDPCDDFYTFACGGWMKRTPIPADKPAWHRSFDEIDERNQTALRKILDGLAAAKGAPSNEAYGDKLAAFWTSCMDEPAIEKSSP